MRKLLSVVGARPQFIKAAAVHHAIARRGDAEHALLHTGQHYDAGMSTVFFDELGIPEPRFQLGIGSGPRAEQIAQMIIGGARVLAEERPDAVIVYGDTNSTLAGAIAANKARVPVAHVEAGLRSWNDAMPEEANRVLCDHCSEWLFCPTDEAVANLAREGIGSERRISAPLTSMPHVSMTGDVMLDSTLRFAEVAAERSRILQGLGVEADKYFLATVHRNYNADDPARLGAIVNALASIARDHALPVVLPMHPRTRQRLAESGFDPAAAFPNELRVVPPVGYLDMIQLERHARLVLTDSGGVQKEAYFFLRPCVVLRAETEWTELVTHGQAALADADPERMRAAVSRFLRDGLPKCPALYGDGHAADRIAALLC